MSDLDDQIKRFDEEYPKFKPIANFLAYLLLAAIIGLVALWVYC